MELRVKEVCKSKGISQMELADKLGITRVTLSRQINGNMSVNTLARIAEVLNVPITDLFVRQKNSLTALIFHDGTYYRAQTLNELKEVVVAIEGRLKCPF